MEKILTKAILSVKIPYTANDTLEMKQGKMMNFSGFLSQNFPEMVNEYHLIISLYFVENEFQEELKIEMFSPVLSNKIQFEELKDILIKSYSLELNLEINKDILEKINNSNKELENSELDKFLHKMNNQNKNNNLLN